MKIKLRSYAEAGVLASERLVMDILEDVDLGGYAVLKSSIGAEGNPTAGSKAAYWFPNKKVKKGDIVVLYTKTGSASEKVLDSGFTAHFYYWKRDAVSWGKLGNSIAVLLESPSWKSLRADWS